MARRPSTKPSATPAEDVEEVEVEVETEEVEDLDVEETDDADDDASDDVDDLEVEDAEDEVEEEKPAKKRQPKKEKAEKPAKVEIQFGSNWLAEHVSKQTGKELTPFTIRTIMRKMVKEGLLVRDVGQDRSRYSFEGPKDERVVAIVKFIKSGAADAAKKEKIAEAKATSTAKKGTKAKATKPAPEPEADDAEDVEDL